MHTLALVILFVSFFGIPFFLLLAVIQFFRGKSSKTLFKIGIGLIPLLIIGIVLGEFTTPNYYDRYEQTEAQKKEERKIQENINKNWDKVEADQKKYEETVHEQMADTLRGPKEMRSDAKSLNYKSIEKDPNRYIGEYVIFEGKIIEIREVEGGGIGYIIALNVGDGNLVRVRSLLSVEYVTGESITVYGTLTDLISYTNHSGDKVTAPSITADLIE